MKQKDHGPVTDSVPSFINKYSIQGVKVEVAHIEDVPVSPFRTNPSSPFRYNYLIDMPEVTLNTPPLYLKDLLYFFTWEKPETWKKGLDGCGKALIVPRCFQDIQYQCVLIYP